MTALGISSISERIRAVEQILQRAPLSSPHQLQQLTLPDMTVPPQPTSGATPPVPAVPANSNAGPANVIAKLTELSTAFQHILSLDPSVQQYMARAASIETLLETHGSSGSTAVAIPPASLVTREEEVVLATSQQFENSAVLLQQLQALLPVLDQKWPLEDFSSLNQRVDLVYSLLPRQAFESAKAHVQLERYLSAYNVLLDFLSRQFILWNQQLNALEEQIDQKIAQKQLRGQ